MADFAFRIIIFRHMTLRLSRFLQAKDFLLRLKVDERLFKVSTEYALISPSLLEHLFRLNF